MRVSFKPSPYGCAAKITPDCIPNKSLVSLNVKLQLLHMHKVEFINLLENIIRHPCCLIARLRVEKLSVIAVNDILSKHNPETDGKTFNCQE